MSTDLEHVNQEYTDIIEQPNIADIAWDIAKIDNLSDIKKTKLFEVLESFAHDHHDGDHHERDHDHHIIVSLSGGVDSMVLASLFVILKQYHPLINIIAIHINYKNRAETDLEESFIKEWCDTNSIVLESYNMGDLRRDMIQREYYEQETKRRRFEYYRELIKKYGASGIYLAHHKGDEQENTFSNIINGKGLLSLSAMQDVSEINNVKILRPLINFPKDDLIEFAHMYNVPYFKDTTPDWSNRGKLRRNIFPLLESVYGNKYLINFTTISHESNQWKDFITSTIVMPFISKYIQTELHNNMIQKIIITIDPTYRNHPQCFWDLVLKSQSLWIAKKTVAILVYKINSSFIGKIPLRKNISGELTSTELIINLPINTIYSK